LLILLDWFGMMNHPIGDNEQQFCQQREENEKIMGLLHPIETN